MAANLAWYLTGGLANSDPDASLGGVRSTTAISATALNNMLNDVSPEERAAGSIKYRVLELVNLGDAATTQQDFYFASNTTSADTALAAGYDATAGSHALTDNLELLANEDTAPASPAISFGAPTEGVPLALPAIGVGEGVRVHFRRTVTAGATSFIEDTAVANVDYL